MRNLNCNILTATDSASHTGGKIDANQLISASFIGYASGGALGAIKVQASNDPTAVGYLPDDFTPTNWVDVPSATAVIASGNPGVITIANMAYRWVRIVYTRTSGGTGNIKVDINALSI